MDRAVGLPEKESGAHRLHGVRAHHQRDVPGIGEVTIVNFHVPGGQRDLAARVGMVPADRLPTLRAQIAAAIFQQHRQPRVVFAGKRERGAQRVLALQRPRRQDTHASALARAPKHSADLRAAVGNREERLHGGHANLLHHGRGPLDRERTLRHMPGLAGPPGFQGTPHFGPFAVKAIIRACRRPGNSNRACNAPSNSCSFFRRSAA